MTKEIAMTFPEWLKPGILGAACGAAALAVVGFSWGGWTTENIASAQARSQARSAVTAALAPVCLEQARADPQRGARIAEIEAASGYRRRSLVIDAGWATMPGADTADRRVAAACLEGLEASF
jgi:dienelactone hydrolase